MSEPPEHVARALHERIEIQPYDPGWPAAFAAEAARLRALLAPGLIGRIEHFGSTAVPGLAAKPIVDMLMEVRSLEDVAVHIAPALQGEGYEYFWRAREPGLPGIAYAWFIRRDARGRRTHHIHCLVADAPEWERLLLRDYLRAHPEVARAYGELKQRIAREHPDDRLAYARAKTDFIERVMRAAREACV
ncbi:GrpB family protein [Thauera chlorobenzoica]|uniref:Uncharacterized protein n=1 Tax=Thauera chlorobenzoica TaxID=96773 RepID=A0A1H5S2H0_9RHOO|nr:GrpB family protein [Thauera chlorobenzoica]APR05005.1 hypothetical protein Tchl_2162 [Thauera chlorobenzoica]SEF44680.1 GrpB domain, predicted nucleotidyltransferase, UPF0157 family [Thauera chlorobenzoica]